MSDGLSPSDQALADAAFRASEDELLVALGEALAGGEARDLQPRDLRARAEAWLRRNHERLRTAICGHPDLPELEDSVMDVAAIADLLAASLDRPTAFTVAAILIKRGIRLLCA